MIRGTLKKTYTTYRLFIFPVAVIFSCLILIVFIIYPQITSLIENYQTEGNLKSKFKVMEAKAQALEGVDEDDLNAKLKLALNVYPSDYDFSSVVGTLQGIVGKYGFIIVSLQLGGVSKEARSSVSDFNVKLELIGPKGLLSDLINGIESSSRIMKTGSIEVSSARQGDNINIILNLKVYYSSLPNSFGSADSSLPRLSEKEEAVLASLARLQQSAGSSFTIPVSKGKPNPFE